MRKYLLILLAVVVTVGAANAQFFNRMTLDQREQLEVASLNLPTISGRWIFVDDSLGS